MVSTSLLPQRCRFSNSEVVTCAHTSWVWPWVFFSKLFNLLSVFYIFLNSVPLSVIEVIKMWILAIWRRNHISIHSLRMILRIALRSIRINWWRLGSSISLSLEQLIWIIFFNLFEAIHRWIISSLMLFSRKVVTCWSRWIIIVWRLCIECL